MNTDPMTTPPAARKAPTKLDTASLFKLLDWMRQHEAEVKDQPDTQLARRASADLGAEITLANFSHARKSARIEKTEPPKPPTVEERLTQLENLFAAHFPLSQSPAQPSPPLPVSESPATLPGLESENREP